MLAVVAALLAFELAPLPRQLYAAPVPDFYSVIASDPRDVRVLGIPLGFVDGEGGEGRYDGVVAVLPDVSSEADYRRRDVAHFHAAARSGSGCSR